MFFSVVVVVVAIVVVAAIVWMSPAIPHNRNDHNNDNHPASAGLTTTSGISKNRFSNRQIRKLSFPAQASPPVK
jgi:hypothetical protein